jgi:hypothetical protein
MQLHEEQNELNEGGERLRGAPHVYPHGNARTEEGAEAEGAEAVGPAPAARLDVQGLLGLCPGGGEWGEWGGWAMSAEELKIL